MSAPVPDEGSAASGLEWQPVTGSDEPEWEPVVADQAPAPAQVTSSAPPAPAAGTPRRRGGSGMAIAVACSVGILVVALIAFILVRQGAGGQASQTTTSVGATPGTTVPATELTDFKDPVAGVNFRYPKQWKQVAIAPGARRVVLLESGDNGMWVSLLTVPAGTTDLKTFARQTITANSAVPALIRAEQDANLGGLKAFYFLYTFPGEAPGSLYLHAHYFVQSGDEMVTIVFQTQSVPDFQRLAAVFDQVVETFTFPEPVPPPTAATTTTAP